MGDNNSHSPSHFPSFTKEENRRRFGGSFLLYRVCKGAYGPTWKTTLLVRVPVGVFTVM